MKKTRDPVLLLIFGSPPPVTVKKQGLRDITEAITDHLQEVLDKTGGDAHLDDLVKRIPEVVSWITWAELDTVVARQLSSVKIEDPSLRGTVERLALQCPRQSPSTPEQRGHHHGEASAMDDAAGAP